jgi:hypothetical protein
VVLNLRELVADVVVIITEMYAATRCDLMA